MSRKQRDLCTDLFGEPLYGLEKELFEIACIKILEEKSQRDALIVSERYGFLDGKQKTLKEVGNITKSLVRDGSISKERARLIIMKSYRRLRHYGDRLFYIQKIPLR